MGEVAVALNDDDLMFAKVRAKYYEPPGQVVASLIDAAGRPERLDGVTSDDVLVHAADVLVWTGDPQAAASMLRRLLDDGSRGQYPLARQVLARALIAAGDADGAEAELRAVSAAAPSVGFEGYLAFLVGMVQFAKAGYYEHALRCAAAIDDLSVAYGAMYQDVAQAVREKIRAITQADSVGVAESWTSQSGPPARTDLALWWPQAEHIRLERQIPELTAIIGSPWRQHIAGVEASSRDLARRGHREQQLLPAAFDDFVAYLMVADVDPRTKAALDGFAVPGRATGDWLVPTWVPDTAATAAWPPGPKEPCWCGSGQRYKKCCGALTA